MSNAFFALVGAFLLIYTYNSVKKNLFSEKESFFWMIGSVCVFIISLFPQIIIFISDVVGVEYAPSLLFLLTSVFMLFLLLRQSQHISVMNAKIADIIQNLAVLDAEIRKSGNK